MNLKTTILTQNDIKCKVDNFILFHREAVTILAHAVDLSLLFKVRQLLLYFANVEGLKTKFKFPHMCVMYDLGEKSISLRIVLFSDQKYMFSKLDVREIILTIPGVLLPSLFKLKLHYLKYVCLILLLSKT